MKFVTYLYCQDFLCFSDKQSSADSATIFHPGSLLTNEEDSQMSTEDTAWSSQVCPLMI